MLEVHSSRNRQQRLLNKIAEEKLDAIVVGLPHHVYYFSAYWTKWTHQSAFVLFADGTNWLCTPNEPAKNVAADDVVSFEAQWMATLRQEQPAVVAQKVVDVLKKRGAKRIGIDASSVMSQVAWLHDGQVESIDPVLWQMRRA